MCKHGSILECEFCGKQFTTSQGLGKHKTCCKSNPNRTAPSNKHIINLNLSRSKNGGWECRYCSQVLRTKQALYAHYASYHADTFVSRSNVNHSWQCEYCKSEFSNRKSLYSHYKVCDEKSKLPVDSRGHTISQKVLDGRAKRLDTINKEIESGDLVYVGHPHSEESKRKLSIARHNNIVNGIGSTWVNPSIKRSYAEQYFFDLFTKENISFESNKWIGHYCVDFLFGHYYLEIDGEQHYTDSGIKHDIEREKILESNGYVLIDRIRWSRFKSLSECDKVKYIDDLVSKIKLPT
jgi:hypothetical protein